MTNLFAPAPLTKALLEFRAGRMEQEKNTKWVRPDTRKGLVQLKMSSDDLLHFVWKDRTTGTVETDLILFPEDATYRPVKEAKSGRVYVLEWKTNDKRLFLWMQEPKSDKDQEICDKFNRLINAPPSGASEIPGELGLENLNREDLMQILGQRPPEPRNPENPVQPPQIPVQSSSDQTTSGSSPALQKELLTNVLASFTLPKRHSIGLSEIVTLEEIKNTGLLESPEVQASLLQLLPESEREDPDAIYSTLRSPQFRQALDVLDAALREGHMESLLKPFGIGSGDDERDREDIREDGAIGFLKVIARGTKDKGSEDVKDKESKDVKDKGSKDKGDDMDLA